MSELELERRLLTAFRALSRQYETEQQRHCEQVEALQQRVEQQTAENRTLRRLVEHFGGQVTRLTADLRARGIVARTVELIRQQGRQRGPERDHGPSR